MKKLLLSLVLLGGGAGGYLVASHLSGGAFPTLGLELGGERGHLRRLTTSFLEDIQFKDFVKAASYHAPDKRETVDIPFLLQRLFKVKPEALDVMSYEVVLADLDSTGNRGRVKSRIKVKLLVDGRIEERELMLYFEREDADAPWFMKLEDSLRDLKADPNKKS